jgi:hypothetical protein
VPFDLHGLADADEPGIRVQGIRITSARRASPLTLENAICIAYSQVCDLDA